MLNDLMLPGSYGGLGIDYNRPFGNEAGTLAPERRPRPDKDGGIISKSIDI